jgi:TatA/E family protein of Tat protein translocase
MFGLSASHLIILGIILLIFGGRRLPELGAGLGKGLRAFKAALDGLDEDRTPPKRVDGKPSPEKVADSSADSSNDKIDPA